MKKLSLAEAISAARKRKRLTLLEASDEMGMSKSYLHLLEKGKRTNPTFYILSELLKFYRLKYTSLKPPLSDE